MSKRGKQKRRIKKQQPYNRHALMSGAAKHNETKWHTRAKNYIIQSIKEINWVQEIVVALMTTVMIVFVSTVLLWSVFKASPGEYKGEKLKAYLMHEIATDLHVQNKEEYLHIERMINSDGNTIAICGNYKANKEDPYSGCFAYVFQRKQKSFWNALVGTESGFEIVANAMSKNGINYDRALTCEECFFNDIDEDGHDEILFFYRCNYADRIMRFPIVFQEYNDAWNVIFSDLADIVESDDSSSELPQYINLESIDFVANNINGSSEFCIFGQTRNGAIRVVENPIWGGNDWLYYITASDKDRISTEKTIMVMQRISDHGFLREKNWNGGKAIVYDTEEITEDLYDSKWGIITENGMMFYGEDG